MWKRSESLPSPLGSSGQNAPSQSFNPLRLILQTNSPSYQVLLMVYRNVAFNLKLFFIMKSLDENVFIVIEITIYFTFFFFLKKKKQAGIFNSEFLSFRGLIQIFWPAFSGKHFNIFDYEFPPGYIYRLMATIQMTLTSDMSTIHRKYLLENSFHLLS